MRHDLVCGKNRRNNRKVIVRTLLGQAGRSEIDSEKLAGPGESRSCHGSTTSIPSFIQCGIWQSHQHRAWQSSSNSGFYLDERPVHAQQSH